MFDYPEMTRVKLGGLSSEFGIFGCKQFHATSPPVYCMIEIWRILGPAPITVNPSHPGYHSTQRVEGISGGAQTKSSECHGGQQARGMRWQQVFVYEQVVSDVGHPETKIRYVYSLV